MGKKKEKSVKETLSPMAQRFIKKAKEIQENQEKEKKKAQEELGLPKNK